MKTSKNMVGVVILALAAALSCTLVVAGGAFGQEAPPSFLAAEQPAPTTANIPCEPSDEHPYPVILVHGTFEDAKQNWEVLSGELKAKGYCVFALNYGEPRGMAPIQGSARELDRFVDKVLAYTGAEKVQVVGHSQGGMMPRYWIKFLGGASKLEDLVGIAPSNYGTRLSSASNEDSDPEDFNLPGDPTAEPCYACEQQGTGSRFLKRLNAGDDTPGMGSYTVIATNDDEIIIPFRNCFLKGDRRTINLVVQRYNNGAPVTHQNIYQDPYAKALVFDALDNPGTADPERADFPPPPPTP